MGTEEGIEMVANENKTINGEKIQICCSSNGNKIGAFLFEERDHFCSRDGELLDKRELDQGEKCFAGENYLIYDDPISANACQNNDLKLEHAISDITDN